MNIPKLEKVNEYFVEAVRLNTGAWIEHSKNVAFSARHIAGRCPVLDSKVFKGDKAKCLT